ncbi:hypothetical protein A2U01_0085279, partial [Trifolium medium]|nr:hypothetical protein [Trifolium medium]
ESNSCSSERSVLGGVHSPQGKRTPVEFGREVRKI